MDEVAALHIFPGDKTGDWRFQFAVGKCEAGLGTAYRGLRGDRVQDETGDRVFTELAVTMKIVRRPAGIGFRYFYLGGGLSRHGFDHGKLGAGVVGVLSAWVLPASV